MTASERCRHNEEDFFHEEAAAAAAAAADRLSALPDDVLLIILERLGCLHWAVRTSTLSRRWRRLPFLLSHLDIDMTEFHRKDEDRRTRTVMASYAESVERLLAPDARRKIKVLRLAFYLAEDDNLRSIGQAVDNNGVADVVEMNLLPEQPYREIAEEHLVLNGQRFMSFMDACPGAFGCLTSLKLSCLQFAEPDLSNILRACRTLRELRLANCGNSYRPGFVLRVDAPPTSQLLTLEIVMCFFMQVELISAPRLERLFLRVWLGNSSPPLRLGHVPRLHSVWLSSALLSFQEPFALSDCLTTSSTNSGNVLSTVHLDFRDETVWVRPEDPKLLRPVFGNLKELYLKDIFRGCDLVWTFLLLESAPSLNRFYVKISWHLFCEPNKYLLYAIPGSGLTAADKTNNHLLPWQDEALRRSFKHYNLEFLEIAGFIAEEALISYTRLVMERAVNLKRVRLQGMKLCKDCEKLASIRNKRRNKRRRLWWIFPVDEDEEKLVREQLTRGRSQSSSIKLVMERHPAS